MAETTKNEVNLRSKLKAESNNMANDITLQQLRDASDTDIQSILDGIITAGGLPTDMVTSEFLFKLLKGARKAALTANANLSAGEQILGYSAPVNGPIQTDTTTNEDSYTKTMGLQVTIAADQGSANVTNG